MPEPASSSAARPFRLLRSLLFVPATSQRFFAKAAGSAADGVILDLEDAVAPARKEAAREAAVAALGDVDWGTKTLAVRVNGLDSPHTYRDVVALAERCPRLDLILLPMVDGPEHVRFVATLLEQAERLTGRADPVGICALVETPLGLERAGRIARAHPRLEGIAFGAGDYAAAMGMRSRVIGAPDPEYALRAPGAEGAPRHLADKWHWAMARLANASHAYGLRPLDSAYADFRDEEGFRDACRRAAALGYAGKLLIHPAQVPACNEVFSPAADDVQWARGLLEAMRGADAAGSGAVAVEGGMVDLATVRLAERIVATADAIAARTPR